MDSNSTMDDVGDESHGITVGSGSQGQPEAEPLLISAQHEMLADEPSRAIKLDDRMKTVGRTWLLAAGPSILVCLFAIDFDMLFLSTNYSRRIASDLHELDNAVWVILVGSIMETASNPFYSSVAELLGRRRAALLAAFLTMLGFLFCSLSGQLWHLILARLVVGSGCAGFPLLVAIMLTDTVPLRDFALWRSLIVCAQAVGDLTGGPAGSTLAEKLGWHV
ncbi:major facilitator superfamily domain-containing protein [Dichotomopilus funicola]|uniref:Major facilitator superfamily domain-containing protein n=1 Tax=Dichotomopilus funicola TaxID=1934379 RepID=A0AAN6ZMZ3_9PEZI|nr:major facilitator superfamily domain-containing protein [Dichotomopilus funicola]